MTTRRVKLKRSGALEQGDAIIPGLGIFHSSGERLMFGMSQEWGEGPWYVTTPDPSDRDAAPRCIGLAQLPGLVGTDVIWVEASLYFVLA